MNKKLLIIEDEISAAKQIKWGLGKEYDITIVGDAAEARKYLASGLFPVATLDLGLPPFPDSPREGFILLGEIPELAPRTRVVVITGNDEEENAVRAVGLGAVDFCAKPIDLQVLRIVLARTFRIQELEEANRRLELELDGGAGSLCGMIGVSPAMRAVFERIRHASRTDYPVLITGKTGTGKEMAAKAIHALSARSAGPLVVINCGAIPENLLESELFGHEKGAFTGASARKVGRFELADGGTILLDEIGELPLALQVKILRFLQDATIERVGGRETIRLDVRIMAATNMDLERAVEKGAFREDLYYRLNVVPLRIPELRERPEDVCLLAQSFLQEEARRLGRGQATFSASALAALAGHGWPGNVRELQNRVRRALGTTAERVISPADLGLAGEEAAEEEGPLPTLRQAREEVEQKVVRRALALSGNNISQAARLLEVSRPTLHDLLKRHGIDVER